MTDSPRGAHEPFSVCVEFAAPTAPADAPALYEAMLDALLDHHPDSGPAAGPAPSGNPSVRLFLDAAGVVDALTRGIQYAQAAALAAGIAPDALIGAEILTEAELDRRNAQPPVPELAGVAEAATIVGVSKQRISELEDALLKHRVQALAAGPVYLADGLRAYAATEHNTTRGAKMTDPGLTPAERALLELLHAKATGRPWTPTTTHEHDAHHAAHIEDVLDQGRLRLHPHPTDDFDLQAALATLIGHRLLKTRAPYRAEQLTGHDTDLVVTLTPKGTRHAQAGAATTTR
ncbi:hypothetical protein [Streptacidiphilus sp. EB103A]|uniref:hypothetical protein n=1 Tax=Streptacidiphilus sp. EB103A TaxID=3156275 RepID=UPI0035156015